MLTAYLQTSNTEMIIEFSHFLKQAELDSECSLK